MSILHLFHGVPGSGKSTEAKARFGGLAIVNRDDIRMELFGTYTPQVRGAARAVARLQRERIEAEMRAGHDVVCDDTNMFIRQFRPLVEMAMKYGYEVVHHMMDVDLSVAKERNAARERVVPEYVIDEMAAEGYTADLSHIRKVFSRFGTSRKGEPFAHIWRERDHSNSYEVRLKEWNASDKRVHPSTDEAVIFDMDGTLADVSDLVTKHLRGVKRDFHRFHSESEFSEPNQWVVDDLMDMHEQGVNILVVTARQATYFGATSRWLDKHGIKVSKLYMRGADDFRPDYEAKSDIWGNIVADGYRVVHAWDDNPQVLRLWNELGVPVTEVPAPQWAN